MPPMNGHAQQAAPPLKGPAKRPPRRIHPEQGVAAWCMRHLLELSLAVLVVVLAGNALNPPEYHLSTALTPSPSYHLRSVFSRFLFLSFREPGTGLYLKGRDDAYFIAWWVVAFSFLREALMRWMFGPFARRCGIKERRSVVRFAEQSWSLCYYLIFFALGLYINQTSPYRSLNTLHFWKGYPHVALPALTKWYYLVQSAFWIQQIIVLNLEARRKDYVQMFAHHIITTLLMSSSYVTNFTRIGNSILCTMDLSDIFLPLAKLFKYADKPQLSDATFAVFLVSWIATRHVIFGMIIWRLIAEAPTVIELKWQSDEGYFFDRTAQVCFVLLLVALQVILCIWLGMILRVLWNMFRGGSAEDTRSDDEDDGEDDEEDAKVHGNGMQNGHTKVERKKDR
ncbi:hypothetical protein JCM5296_005118 [Sporobolomyces johnsonii]